MQGRVSLPLQIARRDEVWIWGRCDTMACSLWCRQSLQALILQSDAQNTRRDQGTAFGHCGIVAAASAVLADLEKRGILKVIHACMPLEHQGFQRNDVPGSLGFRCIAAFVLWRPRLAGSVFIDPSWGW